MIEPHPGPETPRVEEAMHSRWVAFAKAGKPGGWPAFGSGQEEWLDFTAAGPVVRQDLLKPRLDFAGALPAPKTN